MKRRLEIEKVVGREILDSRGNPTVEAEVTLSEVPRRAAHPPASSRRWSCATVIRQNSAARV